MVILCAISYAGYRSIRNKRSLVCDEGLPNYVCPTTGDTDRRDRKRCASCSYDRCRRLNNDRSTSSIGGCFECCGDCHTAICRIVGIRIGRRIPRDSTRRDGHRRCHRRRYSWKHCRGNEYDRETAYLSDVRRQNSHNVPHGATCEELLVYQVAEATKPNPLALVYVSTGNCVSSRNMLSSKPSFVLYPEA